MMKQEELLAIIRTGSDDLSKLDQLLTDPDLDPTVANNQALLLAITTNPPVAWRLLADQRVQDYLIKNSMDPQLKLVLNIASLSQKYSLIAAIKKIFFSKMPIYRQPPIIADNSFLHSNLLAYETAMKWRERTVVNKNKALIFSCFLSYIKKGRLNNDVVGRICTFLDLTKPLPRNKLT